MGGKPTRNVDAATSEATVLYMRWNSYQLADFPAWAAAEPHLARSRLSPYARGQIPGEPQPSRHGGPSARHGLRRDLSFHVAGGQGLRAGMTRTARCGTARHCKRDSASNGFGAGSGLGGALGVTLTRVTQ